MGSGTVAHGDVEECLVEDLRPGLKIDGGNHDTVGVDGVEATGANPVRVIIDRVRENHETIGGSLPCGCAVLVGEFDCDRLVRHADPRPCENVGATVGEPHEFSGPRAHL